MTFSCLPPVLYSLRMHELPSVLLLQQSHAKRVSGEELELMGKQASDLYAQSNLTLSQAVVETVKKAGLSPEQVCRVVEFANTKAFLSEFAKEGSHKVIEFAGGPADPSVVLKDLNDGGGGSVFDPGNGHYQAPPPSSAKTASAREEETLEKEAAFEQALGRETAEYPYANPFSDSLEAKEKLAGAYDELIGEIGALQSDLMSDTDRLYQHVKQAALNGATLGEIVTAWSDVTDEPDFVKAAFAVLTPGLLKDGVFPNRDQIAVSLEKTAAEGLVNTSHPLVTSFSQFCQTLHKLAHSQAAAQEVKSHLDDVTRFLKEATSGVIPKAWRAVAGAAESASGPAGKAVEKTVDTLFGSGAGVAGTVAEKAVKYAPHAAVAYGGAKTHKKLEQTSPTYNRALSLIPFTRQNAIRKQYGG